MARDSSNGSMKNRPTPLQTVRSFTRFEPTSATSTSGRQRASTIQSPTSARPVKNLFEPPTSPHKQSDGNPGDVFEKFAATDEESVSPDLSRSQSLPERFDELPIELASLTDRFIESLTAKVYPEPPTIDQLSELFEDFYIKAAGNISTHISTLISRLNRDTSPTPSRTASKPRTLTTKEPTDSTSASQKAAYAQQMLTPSEVSEKRKARKLLEYKRTLLEEAVERRACESVYDRIWRHKSTLDEVRDEKLRSKTAALALVGIGLKDLGIELDPQSTHTIEDVQESLAPAHEILSKMNEERYPLGKLQHLTNAHRSIVDTLYSIHSSSSSADEILPTLIYVLITSPIEGINIISNLYFIQRFRAASKMDGEAAYCLTNLEAAISFLENVDLTSLRAEELPEGPPKLSSGTATPTVDKLEAFPKLSAHMPSTTAPPTTATTNSSASASALQTPHLLLKPGSASPMPSPRHQRALSNIFQPSAKAIGAANDAVRNTAEEGFKNISNTLDHSFKFLFGRLTERSSEDGTKGEVIVPKTLDEARQLVSRALATEDDLLVSETSSIAEKDSESALQHTKPEDKLLGIIGGKKAGTIRERSVDSSRSNGSTKRVGFASTGSATDPSSQGKTPPSVPVASHPLDSVKNLGTSLNPLNHLGSAFGGGFRSFSKAVSSPSPPASAPVQKEKDATTIAVSKSPVAEELLKKIEPPIQRFVDMKDEEELRIRDVSELLRDYQRLAGVIRELSGVSG